MTTTDAQKPTLLILCLTPLTNDARVLKQIDMLRDDYRITTCGYGPAPRPGIEHVQIPDSVDSRLNGKLITLGQKKLSYWAMPSIRWIKKRFKKGQYDIVFADDLDTVPVALAIRPRFGVHADLHEYSPALHEESAAWMRRVYPVMDLLCRKYLSKASTSTTVSNGLARKYKDVYGIDCGVVPNAAPYRDAKPTEVHDPIRLVHAGVCLRDRHIDTMIKGVRESDADIVFDLYLMPNDPSYLQQLKEMTEEDPKITVRDGVPYRQLLDTLSLYDVGVHILYPVSFNNLWALPNKLFQNVQARLGMISGPNPEMTALIEQYGFGTVTKGYSASDLAQALDVLTKEQVREWKAAADRAARPLSSEVLCLGWGDELKKLVAKAKAKA